MVPLTTHARALTLVAIAGGVKEESLPPLPSELEALLPLILAAADNLERVQGDALERAELTKLAVTKDGLDKELGVLMVA